MFRDHAIGVRARRAGAWLCALSLCACDPSASPGAADAAADADVPPLDESDYLELGLPVLQLGVSAEIDDSAQRPATLVYQGHRFAGVSAKYRGSTSRKYPKRSYTVTFDEGDPFSDAGRGFEGARRIVLTTTFDDNSHLRQRLAYALWNRLSEEHIPIHTFNAVLYVDGEYRGVYLVSDHIDDDFLDAAGVFGHANLYKARHNDANFRLLKENGAAKANPHVGYTKEEGFPEEPEPGAFADLDTLIEWVATAADEDFARDFEQRMLRSEFEDWLIFCSLIEATDSAGKNAYLYHDARPEAPEPRWRYLPWDFNASFGQNYRTHRLRSTDYLPADFGKKNELFARLLRDEALRTRLFERYRAALGGPWERGEVLALFDGWVREIALAARRDEQKWGEPYRAYGWGGRADFTTHEEEVQYVRRWIEERWEAIDGAL
jgi:spore coat protein H